MGNKKKNRRKTRNYGIDKRKLRKKLKRKPVIKCKEINQFWDKKKTVQQNLRDMGLAFDANMVVKIPREPTTIEEVRIKPKQAKIPQVVESMEMEVALGEKEKRFLISSEDVHFCIHMMETYNENYKAMARDKKNYYQLTPKQIRDKIRSFKRSKTQYQEYLDKKKTETNVAEQEQMES